MLQCEGGIKQSAPAVDVRARIDIVAGGHARAVRKVGLSDAGGAYYPVRTGASYAAWTDQSNGPFFGLRCTASNASQETGSKVRRVIVIIL